MVETDITNDLKEIAKKHTVRFEVWPHHEISDGKMIMVGFDLELYGTHDHGTTQLSPGCPLCVETFRDLRRIAEWILPTEERPSEYEILAFDHSLHSSSQGRFEVMLPIRIEHRHNFFDPVDSCEERCLREMRENLTELGIPGGRARPR